MKYLGICCLFVLLSGCRKYDGRHYEINVVNNATYKIAAAYEFSSDTTNSPPGFVLIDPKSTGVLPTKSSYESIINQDSKNEIQILVKDDSLWITRKKYFLNLDSLIKLNWTITYP